MKTEINYKALIPYFICTVTYIFAAIMSADLITQTLILQETSYKDLEHIYYYDILGYGVAGVMLLIVSSYFSFKQIGIFSLVFYLLCLANLGFSEYDERLTEIYALIYSGTNLIIITILLISIFSDKKITKTLALSVFFISVVLAYFLAQLTLQILLPNNSEEVSLPVLYKLASLNIAAAFIFLCVFIFNASFKSPVKSKTTNILLILKNTDLEMLSFFSVFYIIMTIFYDYEVYELTDSLLIISVSTVKYYLFIGIFLITSILQRIIQKYNLHQVNLVCILALLMMFVSMPFWGTNRFFDSMCWLIIGVVMYMFCGCNILILAEKWSGANLRSAITLCLVAASIGYYCGYITIDNTDEEVHEYHFLISICLTLIGLLTYYFYIYKRNKLAKW